MLKQTQEMAQNIPKVVDNARAMAKVFKENGFKLLTDGTDSLILLLDLSDSNGLEKMPQMN